MFKKVPADVLDVLAKAECVGTLIKLPGQLDRSEYLRVDKVLRGLGATWNRKRGGHVLAMPGVPASYAASQAIADLIVSGGYIDPRKELQFYETPYHVAERVANLVVREKGARILEPSAGLGAIARAVRDAHGHCECIELNSDFVGRLRQQGFGVAEGDFLSFKPSAGFSGVAMNPPFSRSRDISHVQFAYKWLGPDGVLAAVMSVGWTFRTDKKATGFRDWLENVKTTDRVTWEPLPDGTFKPAVSVKTGILTVRKGLA